MRLFRRLLPFLILTAVSTTTLSGCFLFKRKNHCGDCPSFNKKHKKEKR